MSQKNEREHGKGSRLECVLERLEKGVCLLTDQVENVEHMIVEDGQPCFDRCDDRKDDRCFDDCDERCDDRKDDDRKHDRCFDRREGRRDKDCVCFEKRGYSNCGYGGERWMRLLIENTRNYKLYWKEFERHGCCCCSYSALMPEGYKLICEKHREGCYDRWYVLVLKRCCFGYELCEKFMCDSKLHRFIEDQIECRTPFTELERWCKKDCRRKCW